ncbi:MAG: hypothetical protein KL787_01980 [Taibaiella sp.]|nr:hypothetical protein [Taibaiella sp.]
MIIDARETEYIDFDVVELIREFHDVQAPNKNINVSLVGFKNIYKIPEASEKAEKLAETLISQDHSALNKSAGKYRKLIKEID